jgi:ribosomal protein L37AE/L43A
MSKEFLGVCPYCGSSRLERMEKEVKCSDCGMGKYSDAKR